MRCTRTTLDNSRVDEVNIYREQGRTLTVDRVFGRENEKEHLVGWLTNTSNRDNKVVMSNNNVPIMSIIGHGGIGKTILAQLIPQQSRIKKHFQTVIWVSASTNFCAATLISKIIQSVTLSKPNVETYDALQEHLAGTLQTIKYLLILDDVSLPPPIEVGIYRSCPEQPPPGAPCQFAAAEYSLRRYEIHL